MADRKRDEKKFPEYMRMDEAPRKRALPMEEDSPRAVRPNPPMVGPQPMLIGPPPAPPVLNQENLRGFLPRYNKGGMVKHGSSTVVTCKNKHG